MAFCNQQDPGSWRCLPWSKKGIWSSWPLYSSKTIVCLSPKSVDGVFSNILSTRQNTARFPEWAIFYWRHSWMRYTTGICIGSTSILHIYYDLPLNITNDSVVCHLFADDNSIHSCGSQHQSVQTFLQEGLYDVSKWCDQNGMVIGRNKTKYMGLTTG